MITILIALAHFLEDLDIVGCAKSGTPLFFENAVKVICKQGIDASDLFGVSLLFSLNEGKVNLGARCKRSHCIPQTSRSRVM